MNLILVILSLYSIIVTYEGIKIANKLDTANKHKFKWIKLTEDNKPQLGERVLVVSDKDTICYYDYGIFTNIGFMTLFKDDDGKLYWCRDQEIHYCENFKVPFDYIKLWSRDLNNWKNYV